MNRLCPGLLVLVLACGCTDATGPGAETVSDVGSSPAVSNAQQVVLNVPTMT